MKTPLHLACLLVPVSALAQTPTPLVLEGDAVPGVGTVTRIDNIAIYNQGVWLVEADTDNADTDADVVLLDPTGLLFREGQALPAPMGATLDSFDSVTLGNFGNKVYNFFLDGTAGGSDDSGIYRDDQLLIQESDISNAPELTAGTPFIGFFDVKSTALSSPGDVRYLLLATVDDASINSTVDQVLFLLDPINPNLTQQSVIAKEGDILPGQTEPIATFGTGPHSSAFAGFGVMGPRAMFFVDLEGDSSTDGAIYLDDTLLAQEGSPSPVAGRNWSSLASPELDLTSTGHYAFNGSLDGDTNSNAVIVRDGVAFRQEGDSLPAIGSFQFTSFGSGPLSLSLDGDLLWYGDWNDPDTDIDTGLFLNDQLLVQEGVTVIAGSVVDTLRGIQEGYFLSDDGASVIFEAILEDGREGAFLIRLGLGENYCQSNAPGGIDYAASLSARGSASLADNDLTLFASPVPVQPGLVFFGPNQISLPFGNGFRCVGGQIVRTDVSFPSGGLLIKNLDVAAFAVPLGQVNFQYWYRDIAGGPTTFNLTDGLAITFVP